MLTYPQIDPVAVSLGPVQVHWYGIMYLCAFVAAWLIAMKRARRTNSPLLPDQVEDLIVYGALGVIIGGRCGYVLFYHFDAWLADPLWLFRVWEGGMSFHGGLIGVSLALVVYARKLKCPLLSVADFVAPIVPLGLGFGRIGNFIGGELWGRSTEAAWGMVFPQDPEQLVRHPSQLYQAFLEGLLLFVILYWYSAKPRPRGAVAGLFLILYGCFRFVVEFVREPDSHLKNELLLGWMSRGQLLSLPMIMLGLAFVIWAYCGARQSAQADQACIK